MLAKVRSCATIGLTAELVDVEVDINAGLERVTLVGLPDAAVRESSERVRAALVNSGFAFPKHRLTVNLAPANLRKVGPAYDLPIALGVLLATGQAPGLNGALDDALVLGELSLDGSVRHIFGVLPMAAAARTAGFRRLFLPAEDAPEAALVDGIEVYGIERLEYLAQHLNGSHPIAPTVVTTPFGDDVEAPYSEDFSAIKGQESAKRALEVAVSGGHNVIMKGAPGAGKTLLARALPSIMPRLTLEEALEVTQIYSVADKLSRGLPPLIRQRPFRSPHHTVSHPALVGGGAVPRPGEVSLAHRGVLFLDELPEFNGQALETLRQPLEDRVVTISRVNGSLTYPASFILVGAMNPCPCGFFGDNTRDCSCTLNMVQRYQSRISGPLLDRIDIHLDIPRLSFHDLTTLKAGESSAAIRKRVEAARARQTKRFAGHKKKQLRLNADMGPAEVQEHVVLDDDGMAVLRTAMRQMQLTARGVHRVLKLARTIADLDDNSHVTMMHLAEALQYRPKVAPI